MASLPDLYAVLGVRRDASDDDIRRAYRRLAREHHPDLNADPEAEQRFKDVTAAYETLSDPGRRRQYDLFGGQGGPMGFPFGDVGDIFDAFFGGAVGGRRRGRGTRTRTQRGEDLFVELSLTFEEAVFGVQKDIELDALQQCERCQGSGCEPGTFPSRCARCGGTGELQDVSRSLFGTVMTARPCSTCQGVGDVITSPCSACGGQGRVAARRSIPVEIPAGVSDRMELRVPAGGHEGRQGGPQGDLYVSLNVTPHPVFERRGQDLVCALPVAMTQAALGADLRIPTLEGTEMIRLDPGTASGTVIRLRGRGVPHVGRRARGDLYVTVMVETPVPTSKEERALLEELAELRGEGSESGNGLIGKLRKLVNP
jgi:molecular chaperone DnaJ